MWRCADVTPWTPSQFQQPFQRKYKGGFVVWHETIVCHEVQVAILKVVFKPLFDANPSKGIDFCTSQVFK